MGEDQNTKPTPPSGMPAFGGEDHEIRAPRSTSSIDIAAALSNIENAITARFDKLDTKVDKAVERLTNDDEALRLDYRRLEQRQAASDEDKRLLDQDLRDLREDIRKDREARTNEKATTESTVEAMKRHVESATQATALTVEKAVAKLDAATVRFDSASTDAETKNAFQDKRLDAFDKFAGAVCDELGIETPDGIEKPPPSLDENRKVGKLTRIVQGADIVERKSDGTRRVTWAAVALGAIQLIYLVIKVFASGVTHLP